MADMLKVIEAKRIELKEKEELLKREEQRLNTLKKAVEEKIEAYTKLLTQVETTIKKIYAIPDLENFLGDRLRDGR